MKRIAIIVLLLITTFLFASCSNKAPEDRKLLYNADDAIVIPEEPFDWESYIDSGEYLLDDDVYDPSYYSFSDYKDDYYSEEDKILFFDAVSEVEYFEEDADYVAEVYYDFWLRELYHCEIDYPSLKKVEVVIAPKGILSIKNRLPNDYALQLVDVDGNAFILYRDNRSLITGLKVMLYNGEVVTAFYTLH